MSRKDQFQPNPPRRLKFIGSGDSFVAGVPRRDLEVSDEATELDQITPEKAEELLKTGLYVEDPSDG